MRIPILNILFSLTALVLIVVLADVRGAAGLAGYPCAAGICKGNPPGLGPAGCSQAGKTDDLDRTTTHVNDQYFVAPAGSNYHDGLTAKTAWRSLDRGQPTQVREAAAAGADRLAVGRAVQLPFSGVVRLVFGPHAPPGIRIAYAGRDGFTLLDVRCASGAGSCSRVPAIPAGAMVYSEDWPAPASGSTINAAEGVYAFPPNATTAAALPLAHYDAAYFMSGGITLVGSVSSTGQPLSVIDGRSLSKTAITVDGTSHVALSGFDIRRGSVYANQADHFSLTHSRVHHATEGVSIAYSQNVTIFHNKVFDNSAGAQADGIAVHRGTDWIRIENNSISNNDCCLHIYPGASATRPHVVIEGNVITRCTDFAGIVAEPGVQLSAVRRNNVWLTGKGGGLKDLSPHGLATELKQYYYGVNQSSAFRTQAPDDLHEDPEIVSWDEASPGFLCVASGSTSAMAGIGACSAAAPVLTAETSSWQGVLNSDFSAGMWAWQGHVSERPASS